MKKITYLTFLLFVSVGIAQTTLEDFESSPIDLSGFEGLGGANVIANPQSDANNSSATVGELIVAQAGNPWQGANLIMQDNYIDVSNPATQPVSVLVYSDISMNMLARLAGAQDGATESAADAAHGGSGWETLTFTFNEALDGTGVANGEYGTLALFPNWNGAGWHDPEIENTVYIDNISGTAGAAIGTCSNGVQDGDETGVDCGGSCDPCPTLPTEAAPTPPARDPADVVAYYSNAYAQTSNWGQIDVFGSATLIDVVVEGNDTYQLIGAGGEGFQYNYFASGGSEDLSGMTHYHVDIWVEGSISGGEVFTAQLLNYDGTDALESNNFYQAPITSTNQWISVDVPLTSFTNASGNTNYDNIKLVQIILQGPAFGPVFFDNFYFHNNQTLSAEEFELSEVKVFPNPTNNLWNVKSDIPISSIAVYDILGKQVILNEEQNKDIAIDASGLASGVYFARISAGDLSKVVRLVKE